MCWWTQGRNCVWQGMVRFPRRVSKRRGIRGACVALVRPQALGQVAEAVLEAYGAQGHHGQQLVP